MHALTLEVSASDPVEREQLAAQLWSLGCEGVEEREDALVAYFGERPALPASFAGRATWSAADDTDWVAAYLAELGPVSIGRLVVAPTHAAVTLRSPQRPLWIDPGLAFGSGHHETTRLALAALERCDLRGARVLDVGAGSGILAIAADLLGASTVHGLDTDPATVPVAEANAERNDVRATFEAEPLAPDAGRWRGWADVVVANIYAEVHAALAASYRAATRATGRVLLTGIVEGKQGQVARALEAAGFEVVRHDVEGAWHLLEATPTS